MGRPLTPVSTQENKHRTGLFSILYYPHRRTKKVENTPNLNHRITGSNWNRKLVPKAYARVCGFSYFPEWKPVFKAAIFHCSRFARAGELIDF